MHDRANIIVANYISERLIAEIDDKASIKSFLPDLVTAVSDSVLSVSDQCLAKGLIPGNVHDQVLESGGTSEDKARTLIL